MKSVDLNDKRLNRRVQQLLAQLAGLPTASIPAACGGNAEMTAAYRFFDNHKVGCDGVLPPPIDTTRLRSAAQPVGLLVPDTTELDLTRPEPPVPGAGPRDGGSRRGVLRHRRHAFTPDGTPLGTVPAIPGVRDDDPPRHATRTRTERAAEPIAPQESFRGLLSMHQARAEAEPGPGTRLISVADSAADLREVRAAGRAPPRTVAGIVRSGQDRALVADLDEARATRDSRREEVQAAPVRFRQTIPVRGRTAKVACADRTRRQPRKAHAAVVAVRAARVTRRAPERPAGQLPAVTVNAVLVTQVDPPADEVAGEWLLLTRLPIGTRDQVRVVVQYYCTRWVVEILFRVLKSGCRVEKRRFERGDRLLPCRAVSLIVAWRTWDVCRLGRSCPEINCEAVFEPAAWKSVYQVVKRQPPPKQPPQLQEMVRLVAPLGGYVNRKRADEPGPQTVWLGLQRLHDIALCWQVFGPGADEKNATAGVKGELV
jgi:hypothetical protein